MMWAFIKNEKRGKVEGEDERQNEGLQKDSRRQPTETVLIASNGKRRARCYSISVVISLYALMCEGYHTFLDQPAGFTVHTQEASTATITAVLSSYSRKSYSHRKHHKESGLITKY